MSNVFKIKLKLFIMMLSLTNIGTLRLVDLQISMYWQWPHNTDLHVCRLLLI